jgi:hypothetical protein
MTLSHSEGGHHRLQDLRHNCGIRPTIAHFIGKGNIEENPGDEPTIMFQMFLCFCLYLKVSLSAFGVSD